MRLHADVIALELTWKSFVKSLLQKLIFEIPRLFSFQLHRFHSTLVIAEYNEIGLTLITRNAITAANKIGEDVTVLVAGYKISWIAKKVAKLKGVSKVLVVDDNPLKRRSAETITDAVVALQSQLNFTHILTGATAFGRNVAPRVAAKLDVSPVSDVIDIKSADTFVRTIYAGNAIQTLKVLDPVKVFTIRGTSFEATAEGGDAPIEIAADIKVNGKLSRFIEQKIQKSDRPELTSANVIISGGEYTLNSNGVHFIFKLFC